MSTLCLNFFKNFSLSSSATLKRLSMKVFLSFMSSFLTSTSLCSSSLLPWTSDSTKDLMILVLNLLYVGNFSMAAHFRASSSPSTRLVLLESLPAENTSSMFQPALIKLLLMLLLKLLWLDRLPEARAFSSPSIFLLFWIEFRRKWNQSHIMKWTMQQKGNNLCVPNNNNNNNIDKTKKKTERRPSIVWLLRESKLSPMSNKR